MFTAMITASMHGDSASGGGTCLRARRSQQQKPRLPPAVVQGGAAVQLSAERAQGEPFQCGC